MPDQIAAAGERSPSLRFAFGLNKSAAIAELRALADKLESGLAVLQRISTAQRAHQDDFGIYEVSIEFAERNPHFDAAKREKVDAASHVEVVLSGAADGGGGVTLHGHYGGGGPLIVPQAD